MNTVDSWIDPELIADLVKRLTPAKESEKEKGREVVAAGQAVAGADSPLDAKSGGREGGERQGYGLAEKEIEGGHVGRAGAAATRLARGRLRSAVEVATGAEVEEPLSGAALSPEGVEELPAGGEKSVRIPAAPRAERLAEARARRGKGTEKPAWPDSIAAGELPGGRRRQISGEPAARKRVRRRLAEIKEQATRSGLLGPVVLEGTAEPQPFTSADAATVASVEASTGARALGERLRVFADGVKERFGCVRVLVSDSRGATMIPGGDREPALLAAAQSLSHSWLGCQKHLRLKDPGVLSTVLGKGYRLVVIPCETSDDLISLAMVTRDLVSDAETVKLRKELLAVLEESEVSGSSGARGEA